MNTLAPAKTLLAALTEIDDPQWGMLSDELDQFIAAHKDRNGDWWDSIEALEDNWFGFEWAMDKND